MPVKDLARVPAQSLVIVLPFDGLLAEVGIG